MTATRRKSIAPIVLGLLGLAVVLLPAASARADFSWDIDHLGAAKDFFEIEAFHTTVTNTGTQTDTVLVNMVKNIPNDWVASLCEETLCYPPFLLDIELVLAPGDSTELIIDMTPIAIPGIGSTDITLVSKNNPSHTAQATFSVLTAGADVLYVSTEGSAASDALFTDAITNAGKTFAVWDKTVFGSAKASDVNRFATVVWGAGATSGQLNAVDRDCIAAYLAGSGQLLLSGANLAADYCTVGSPNYDAAACAWFDATLSVGYQPGPASTDYVSGGPSDPVFPSATYNINGGDGANTNSSPDRISATAGGQSSLAYSGGGTAVVARAGVASRSLFAGFDFAGIASATERDGFMALALSWLTGAVTGVGDAVPAGFARLPSVSPNPFNPRTVIRFEVGGERELAATVAIYDVRGRALRDLFAGTVQPGPRALAWDGRDDGGQVLPAGVYLARVRLGKNEQVVKMTLAK